MTASASSSRVYQKTIFTGALLVAAFLVAFRSPYPLIRVGALLAVLGLAMAWVLAQLLARDDLRAVTAWCWVTIIAVGASVFLVAWLLGGSAVNGEIDQRLYYVMERGHYSAVSAAWYIALAALELLAFFLVPAGLLLAVAAEKPN